MDLLRPKKNTANDHHRYKWAPLKTRKIVYQPPPNKSILEHVPKPNNSGKTNQ